MKMSNKHPLIDPFLHFAATSSGSPGIGRSSRSAPSDPDGGSTPGGIALTVVPRRRIDFQPASQEPHFRRTCP